MKYKFTVLLVTIFLAGLSTRIFKLAGVPVHFSNDEISIAYDAYSVLHTSRDEHNNFLPMSFQSHSTYKAPLTAYLLLPTTALLGPGEMAARLPSAVLGSLTVLVMMLLVLQLFRNVNAALFTGMVLALTPWHIATSHMVLEANAALFFVAFGLLLFFKYLENQKFITLAMAILFEALSIYGYHTEWIFTPLLMLTALVVFRKKIKIKIAFLAGILFIVILTPLIVDTLYGSGRTSRANTESLIYEPTLQSAIHDPKIGLVAKTHTIVNAVVSNYANYWNLGYLFAYGLDIPPKPLTTQSGLFLATMLPFFLAGLIISKNLDRDRRIFLWSWLVLAPLIPALTKGGANQVRALVMVLPISVIIGLGFALTLKQIKKPLYSLLIITVPVIFGFAYFGLLYYFHYPIHSGVNFQYGYRQAASFINNHKGQYARIVVDPKFGDVYQYVGVPHLYLAYFTAYDPALFLINRQDTAKGLFFSPYEIREIDWPREKPENGMLYVSPNANLPSVTRKDVIKVDDINYPDGQPAFKIYVGRSQNN